MKELLEQIDPDYYRFLRLLIAQAEIQQLPQWRVDVMRRSKIPLGMSRAPDESRADPHHRNQHFSGENANRKSRRANPGHREPYTQPSSRRQPAAAKTLSSAR
jgi:hypothetical protein